MSKQIMVTLDGARVYLTKVEAAAKIEEQALVIRELVEALEPFAQASNHIERDYGQDTPDAQMQFPPITMGELRRARAAIAKANPLPNPPDPQ